MKKKNENKNTKTKEQKMKTLKTKKQMRQEIADWIDGINNREFATGLKLDIIGYKYCHIISLWEDENNYKMHIDNFYQRYCK